MWFIPLLVIGAIVIAAASRSPREALPSPAQLMFPAPAAPLPGPISVLGEFVRIGHVPPPPVIICAIAEAEAIGRCDLASDIVRAFVEPVVQQANAQLYAPGPMPTMEHAPRGESAKFQRGVTSHERGSCERPRSPRDQHRHAPTQARDARGEAAFSSVVPLRPVAPAQVASRGFAASDDEIRAMLNVDPEGFIEMVKRGGPPVIDVPVVETAPVPLPSPTVQAPPIPPMPSPPAAQPTDLQPHPAMGLPPEVVAQMQEHAGLPEAADQTRASAIGSPIVGVSDDAWREFARRIERESPIYQSARHVGQYRQRRDRLVELGIDPSRVVGSVEAQRVALDADLADAHHHAVQGGLLAAYLNHPIAIPGSDELCTITLSGVLGVIQCAGLDGAVSWLESQRDRKRFPHTTAAFMHTNGVF
jgi:hypothetical protein